MTDSQTLLAEYRQNGSDAAFRELVARFVDLVYSTALRLVEGDTHRAEDVTQTVFVDLARLARTLSNEVRLGGWLHRHTCFVAANTMRGERRRQSRERQAVEMNALQNNSEADFSQVAPLLDEAINELGEADRTAILLRFFEQQDFRAVGQALGSNEDAARMRVTRALEKLGDFLKRRGVTTSAASLGVVLTANAVQAAPVGLAVTISTAAALAGTTVATTATATASKAIAMTTLQKTVFAVTLIAALVATVIIRQQSRTKIREAEQSMRQQADRFTRLQAENERLSNLVAQSKSSNPPIELLRLRGEVGLLRRQMNDLAMLQEENHRLRQQLAAKSKTPQQLYEEERAKRKFLYNWITAFLLYVRDNQHQFPTNFDQAAPFLPADFKADPNITPGQFEIVYHGLAFQTNQSDIVLLREKQPWLHLNGKWARMYGMADGDAIAIYPSISLTGRGGKSTTYKSFVEWEKQHMIEPRSTAQ
jgi:RNA polymerase sigma factor (sigma-70 family)